MNYVTTLVVKQFLYQLKPSSYLRSLPSFCQSCTSTQSAALRPHFTSFTPELRAPFTELYSKEHFFFHFAFHLTPPCIDFQAKVLPSTLIGRFRFRKSTGLTCFSALLVSKLPTVESLDASLHSEGLR